MAQSPTGFTYVQTGDKVVITHHGHRATTLRGNAAARFLAEVLENVDLQQLMARLTGNYKHGNERTARSHPRNQTRH